MNTRNIAKLQDKERGIYNEKEKKFILNPPDKPFFSLLKGNRVSNQCYVIICGHFCEDCRIKKYQKEEEEDVQWEVKIEPAKVQKAEIQISQQEEIEVEPSDKVEREPLIAKEKADECHTRPRRSRKKPKMYVPEDGMGKRNRSPSVVVLSPEQKKVKKKKKAKEESKVTVQVPTPNKLETLIVDIRNGEKESSPEYESNDADEPEPPKQKARKISKKDPKIIKPTNEKINCDSKIEPNTHQIIEDIEKKDEIKPAERQIKAKIKKDSKAKISDNTETTDKNVNAEALEENDVLDTVEEEIKREEKAEPKSALLEKQRQTKKKSKKNSKAKDKKPELNFEEKAEEDINDQNKPSELEKIEDKSSRPSRRRKSKVIENLSPNHQMSVENDIAPRRKKARRSKSFVKENHDLLKIPFDLNASEKSDEASSSVHDESIIKELENQNLIEIANPVGNTDENKAPNAEKKEVINEDENKPLNVALAEEKEVSKSTGNKESGDEAEKLRRMSMKLEAQEKMIQALLAAQTTEHEAKADPPPWWDHSAQREPLLVKMSWEQIAINITEQYPEVAQEVANNEDFEDMLNLDQNVEDSGVASDIVFRYFHLLEKVSFEKKVKAVRPFQFMSEPVKRKNVILKHKLSLKDYEDSLPQSCFENVDLILALVVMDLNRKSDDEPILDIFLN